MPVAEVCSPHPPSPSPNRRGGEKIENYWVLLPSPFWRGGLGVRSFIPGIFFEYFLLYT